MASHESRAFGLFHEGEKKMKGFFGKAGKTEEAAELFSRAGASFRMAKLYREAGNAFSKAGECQIKLKNKHEGATQFGKAAQSYRQDSASQDDAVRALKTASAIFLDMGKLSSAAKSERALAEIYESQDNIDMVIESYENAANYYQGEDQFSQETQCWIKVAQYAAEKEDFQKAIEIYEDVADRSLTSGKQLMRFAIPDYFFRAGLCHYACHDGMRARDAVSKYEDNDANFINSREHKLLMGVDEAVQNGSVETFRSVVRDYDRISRLDSWKTKILLKIKKRIENPELETLDPLGMDGPLAGGQNPLGGVLDEAQISDDVPPPSAYQDVDPLMGDAGPSDGAWGDAGDGGPL